MNIALSARGLGYKAGGAKEFIREMALRLPRLGAGHHFVVYYQGEGERLEIDLPNVTERVLTAPHRLVWDHWTLPRQMKRDGIDVALFFKGTRPVWCPCRTVLSVLDMIYFFPELRASTFWDRQYMLRMIPWSVRRADAVVAISENTRRDVLRLVSGLDPERVTVVPMASGLEPGGKGNVRERFGLGDGPYIFLSSSLSPRKNIERAVRALGLVKDVIPHGLVVTGGTAWGHTRIDEVVAECGLEGRFTKLGFVEEEDLFDLYRDADLYLMPSLYEGFSITLLEAMRAGCPVAASGVSSHPEVIGDAGLMFDPYSVEEMAEAVRRIATDGELRAELRERGLRRAAAFDWAEAAQLISKILDGVDA